MSIGPARFVITNDQDLHVFYTSNYTNKRAAEHWAKQLPDRECTIEVQQIDADGKLMAWDAPQRFSVSKGSVSRLEAA